MGLRADSPQHEASDIGPARRMGRALPRAPRSLRAAYGWLSALRSGSALTSHDGALTLGAAQGWYGMGRWPGKPNPKTAKMCQIIFHRVQEL